MTRAAADRPARYAAFGLSMEASAIAPGLHVVATPIGNLSDISFRALQTLAAADAVLAEDTRVTKTLLAHYGISTPLIAYHEHNAERLRPEILRRLGEGQALALVSDAGTPMVSDPGYKLAADAIAAGVKVTGVPGASAVLAALMVAGMPTDRFFFEGFLPPKAGARRTRLKALEQVPGTLVFFESPHRVADMLADSAAMLGDRPAAVARELTKFYEEVRRDAVPALAAHYAQAPTPKGEIVVLIGAAHTQKNEADEGDRLDALLRIALGKHSLKEAVAHVAAETGEPRRKVYARALDLTKAEP
ncbi:MAG: 16S rRNA (cytidine(1402)-2'-O)-methyltransferase [Beijerinckiaceae bacterium]